MDDKKKRRKWSAADKLGIVMTGIQPDVEVRNLSRQEGINLTQFVTLYPSEFGLGDFFKFV